MRAWIAIILLLAAPAWAQAKPKQQQAGDAARGETLYESRCEGCHSLDANRIGPAHRGVFGRKAGSAPGFAYSPSVKASKVIWTEPSLDAWLTNPQGFIKGSKMGFRVAQPQDRADLIAFLKANSPDSKAPPSKRAP